MNNISDKLEKYFNDNEMHEIEDIMEEDESPLVLIESNIEYALKNLFEEIEDDEFNEDFKIIKINCLYNPEYTGDKDSIVVMGNYKVTFNDDSEFEGRVISRFNIKDLGKYELVLLTIGDNELKHFGNEEVLEEAPWEKSDNNISDIDMIKKIKEKWPKLNLALRSEFTGNENDKGIWFKSSLIDVYIDGEAFQMPIIDDSYEIYSKLDNFLEENNWMAEPYDSETLMAYPNY